MACTHRYLRIAYSILLRPHLTIAKSRASTHPKLITDTILPRGRWRGRSGIYPTHLKPTLTMACTHRHLRIAYAILLHSLLIIAKPLTNAHPKITDTILPRGRWRSRRGICLHFKPTLTMAFTHRYLRIAYAILFRSLLTIAKSRASARLFLCPSNLKRAWVFEHKKSPDVTIRTLLL